MRELHETIAAWQAAGTEFGRAVLVRAVGSAPRPPGATLLVAADGRIAGSVSGGCVEGACIEQVLAARQSGLASVIRYGISDRQAWDVGLACGSTIDVLIEPRVASAVVAAAGATAGSVALTELPAAAPGAADGQAEPASAPPAPVRVVTSPAEVNDGALRAAVTEAIERGRSSVALAADGRQVFVEAFAQRPRLVVFGAVDVARALVRLAHEVGYRVAVVDARAAFLTGERFPDADELLLGWPDELAERLALGPSDSVAVLTHDPKLDDPAIEMALRAGCRYVGAIGSRRTQHARRERLLAAGVDARDVARLRGPIGLDLGGREPGETALAILAEVVAVRHGASGSPLAAPAPPLHAPTP